MLFYSLDSSPQSCGDFSDFSVSRRAQWSYSHLSGRQKEFSSLDLKTCRQINSMSETPTGSRSWNSQTRHNIKMSYRVLAIEKSAGLRHNSTFLSVCSLDTFDCYIAFFTTSIIVHIQTTFTYYLPVFKVYDFKSSGVWECRYQKVAVVVLGSLWSLAPLSSCFAPIWSALRNAQAWFLKGWCTYLLENWP